MEEIINSKNNILNNVGLQEIIIYYHEYFLLKDNNIYKMIIIKYKDKIMIKTKNYQNKFDLNHLKILTSIKLNNIDEAYNLFINIFDENKVKIQKEIMNEKITLIITFKNEEKLEIILLCNKKSENIIINKINNIQNEINKLKEQNKKLIKEINILKKYHDKYNPKDIEFLTDLSSNENNFINIDNSFTVFKSINLIELNFPIFNLI